MKNWLRSALVAGALALSAGAVSAQGLELRIDSGDRYERVQRDADRFDREDARLAQYRSYDRPRYRGRDRRRVREVCRTEIRRRVRPNGVIVERPVRVCRRVVYR